MKKYIVEEDMRIIDAMKVIDDNGCGIVFVCNNQILVATLTDGDVRRHILKNGSLSLPVKTIANFNPLFLSGAKRGQADELMKQYLINAVPIVDKQMHIEEIKFREFSNVVTKDSLSVPLCIMAGGKGTRLKPYTDILPKPLLPIGEKTIVEHIMDKFIQYACTDIYMIVNYKKKFIETYFAENRTNRDIKFIEEDEYLGTGGGLSLLKGVLNSTFFLSNCDIMVDENYKKILEKHKRSRSIITLVCVRKNFVIPYGTVELEKDGYIKKLCEKPGIEYYVNTGMYVIEPSFFDKIPLGKFCNITDIIEQCIEQGERVGSYIIDENCWMDMGQFDTMEQMKMNLKLL